MQRTGLKEFKIKLIDKSKYKSNQNQKMLKSF